MIRMTKMQPAHARSSARDHRIPARALLLAWSAAGLRPSAGWKPAQEAPDSGMLRGWLTMVRSLELRCRAIGEARRLLEEVRASAVEAPRFKGLVPLT